MGILVECPKCKVRGSVKRKVCKCGNQVQKSDSKNYWIEYYINGKRTRERIGRSKQAADNRLREVETAKARILPVPGLVMGPPSAGALPPMVGWATTTTSPTSSPLFRSAV